MKELFQIILIIAAIVVGVWLFIKVTKSIVFVALLGFVAWWLYNKFVAKRK